MADTSARIDGNGWHYAPFKPIDGDARKLVTLVQDGMTWVGIRAYDFQQDRWLNGGEPERAYVKAWKDLDSPARWFWECGQLVDPDAPDEKLAEIIDAAIEERDRLLEEQSDG